MTDRKPIIPSEHSPQPVPGHPGWVWWPGVNGHPYAKHPNGIHPPVVVRAHNFTALLARIRAAERGRP
jgi:hypothetical protein